MICRGVRCYSSCRTGSISPWDDSVGACLLLRRIIATEIDALGVEWAVTHLRSFLGGTELLVRCDHSALASAMTSNSPDRRLTGWRLRLAEFTYQIKHKPGGNHRVADALSRLPTDGLDTTPLDDQSPVLAATTRSAQALTKRNPKGLGPITL